MDSFFGWLGGKKLLRDKILEEFPQEEVKKYVEVFGGAAWVLFRKICPGSKCLEVYNDINSDLVNLFRCVKCHCSEVQKELSFMLNSREQFADYRAQMAGGGLTDIQRAARFFFLIKESFGSKYKHFASSSGKNVVDIIPYLTEVQQRLKRVVIEHKDFADLIQFYDSSTTLFYCDPPYYGAERDYNVPFTIHDHIRLRDSLKGLTGRFILSYNDNDIIRQMYKGYNITTISRSNNLSNGVRKSAYKEIIIKNF